MPETFLDDWERDADLVERAYARSRVGAWLRTRLNPRYGVLFPWLAGLPDGARVLDWGCGSGMTSFVLARSRGFRMAGVDLSARALAIAARTRAKLGVPFDLVRADGAALPFRAGAFDAVVSADVLEHVPSQERAFAEIFRVLRPGGTAALHAATAGYRDQPSTWGYHVCKAIGRDPFAEVALHVSMGSADALSALARAAGFIVEDRRFPTEMHLAFNLLGGRPEPAILARYPEARAHAFIRWNERFAGVIERLHRFRPLRLAHTAVIHALLLASTWINDSDLGGVFLKLRKPIG